MFQILIVPVLISVFTSSVEANRQKRSFIQFGLMLHSIVEDKWPWEYNDYACWCGFGGQGPQLDDIDKCCFVHDHCYEDVLNVNKDCTLLKSTSVIWYSVDYDPIVCKDPEGSCGRLTCECDKAATYCFAANTYHPGLLGIQDCEPCAGYGDILKIKVTGAKSATAKKEGVSSTGVAASQYLVDEDIADLEIYRSCFVQVGKEYGVHPALVAGLASRVSRAGKLLNAQGYGTRDTSKYGIMQCDTRSSNYGSRCTQYGPKTCEHIDMMMSEKLAPDLRHALDKYSLYKERKGQRDAIAAYEHTITEVQSWSSPDSKTNGGDFSSDVIARAHRLIFHHKWTCDGTTPSPHLSGSLPFVPSISSGADTCKKRAERGDCGFYTDCVDHKLPCTDDGYAQAYGHRYCTRFATYYNDFSAQGKKWVDAVKICLMKALLPQTSTKMTCDRIKKVAFDSHLKCYLSSGVDMCTLAANDINNLWNVYKVGDDFAGTDALAAWKQILCTISSCPGTAYADGRGFLEGISDDINAWEKSVTGEILETTEKRRRKRSLDCEQYARWGDCRFYECFEAKFACADHQGYSHIKDFELTSCMKFSGLTLSNIEVGAWMTSTQHCLMDHLMTLYNQDSLDCEMVELHMLEARVSCMVDAGFCSLDSTDEWMIERATDRKGYPYIAPKGYTTLPENNDFVLISDYYYQALPTFKKQIGLASKKCHELGQRQHEELYKFVDTSKFGLLKIRTEL